MTATPLASNVAALVHGITPNSEGTMTTEGIPRSLRWKGLYHVAMLQSDCTKSPPLLDDAINAVLDQIEETFTQDELEELNNALNGLRSRRSEVNYSKSGRDHSPNQIRAA